MRKELTLPPPEPVDYRAACFCHRQLISQGHVCSVCLSSKCQFSFNQIQIDVRFTSLVTYYLFYVSSFLQIGSIVHNVSVSLYFNKQLYLCLYPNICMPIGMRNIYMQIRNIE